MNTLFKTLSLIFLFFLFSDLTHAQTNVTAKPTIRFATVEEGRKILTTRDDFVLAMSPFDRAGILKTNRDVSEKEYLEFVGKNILEWNENEKQIILSILNEIRPKLAALPFPDQVLIIKTTGREEGGAAYTRANAIVFPAGISTWNKEFLKRAVCHEPFHVLSRANPELKEKLYTAIGFVKCQNIDLPQDLKKRMITNPDAPLNDHCIMLKVNGKNEWAVPLIFSKTEKYIPTQGGSFLSSMQFKFILIDRKSEDSATPIYRDGKPVLIDPDQCSDLFEQIGKNTDYIIHPEEILADNFALLLMDKKDVPSPDKLKAIEDILKNKPIPKVTD